MKAYSFENLEVWKESRQLVAMVYDVQKLFPDTEKFGLGSQLRRAVISVPSNLVEGNYRTSTKEQLHFIEMAFSFTNGSVLSADISLRFEIHIVRTT